MKSQLAEDRNGVRAVSFRHDNLISRWPRNLPGQRTMRYSFEVAAADGESPYCGVMEAECDDAEALGAAVVLNHPVQEERLR